MRQPEQDSNLNTPNPEPLVSNVDSNGDDLFGTNQSLPDATSADVPVSSISTPLEATGAQYGKSLLNAVDVTGLKEREIGLVHGQAAEDYVKRGDEAIQNHLNNTINMLPKDDRSWSNTTAPAALGFMSNPDVIAGSLLGESYLKPLLPEATAATSALAKFALKVGTGGATATASGAVVNGVNQAINIGDPHEMSLPQYLTSTLSWGGFGLGEGALKGAWPIVSKYVKGAILKTAEKTVEDPDLQHTTQSNVSRETIANTVDSNVVKAVNGKVMDSHTSLKAGFNEAKDAYANETDTYNNLTDEDKANNLSPDEQYQASIQAHKDARDGIHNDLNNTIDDAYNNIGAHDAIVKEATKISIPDLIKAKSSLKFINSLPNTNLPKVSDLESAIDNAIPKSGTAKRVTSLTNMPMISPKDQDFLDSLQDPKNELETLKGDNQDLTEDNQQRLNAKIAGLQDQISSKATSPLIQHLNEINDHAKNLDDLDISQQQTEANYKLLNQPKDDIGADSIQQASDLYDDKKDIAGFNAPSVDDHLEGKVPNHEPIDYDQQDEKLQSMKDEGLLKQDDLDDIAETDKINNHEGITKLLQNLATCILGGGK